MINIGIFNDVGLSNYDTITIIYDTTGPCFGKIIISDTDIKLPRISWTGASDSSGILSYGLSVVSVFDTFFYKYENLISDSFVISVISFACS